MIRVMLLFITRKGAKDASPDSVGVLGAAVAGSGAAVAASVALCPTELVKCRLQAALETHAPGTSHDPLDHRVFPNSPSAGHRSHTAHRHLHTNAGALPQNPLDRSVRKPPTAIQTRLGFGLSARRFPTAMRYASHVSRSHAISAEIHLYAYSLCNYYEYNHCWQTEATYKRVYCRLFEICNN